MPARWMLQPNGKLARFSTVVDDFTHYDCTSKEALDEEIEDAKGALVEKVRRGEGRRLDSPLGWNESLETIRELRGEKALKKTLKMILGTESPPDPKEVT